jgi:hypothetical protein
VWYLSRGKWAQARQYFRSVVCTLHISSPGVRLTAVQQDVAYGPSLWPCVGCVRTYIRAGGRT